MYKRVLAYIRTQNPDYKYSEKDFKIFNHQGEVSLVWNMDLKKPTEQELRNISILDIEKIDRKKRAVASIPIVQDLSDVDSPMEGSLCFLSAEKAIYIFFENKWTLV